MFDGPVDEGWARATNYSSRLGWASFVLLFAVPLYEGSCFSTMGLLGLPDGGVGFFLPSNGDQGRGGMGS